MTTKEESLPAQGPRNPRVRRGEGTVPALSPSSSCVGLGGVLPAGTLPERATAEVEETLEGEESGMRITSSPKEMGGEEPLEGWLKDPEFRPSDTFCGPTEWRAEVTDWSGGDISALYGSVILEELHGMLSSSDSVRKKCRSLGGGDRRVLAETLRRAWEAAVTLASRMEDGIRAAVEAEAAAVRQGQEEQARRLRLTKEVREAESAYLRAEGARLGLETALAESEEEKARLERMLQASREEVEGLRRRLEAAEALQRPAPVAEGGSPPRPALARGEATAASAGGPAGAGWQAAVGRRRRKRKKKAGEKSEGEGGRYPRASAGPGAPSLPTRMVGRASRPGGAGRPAPARSAAPTSARRGGGPSAAGGGAVKLPPPPKTAAVVLRLPEGSSYADALRRAKEKVSLGAYGIQGTSVRRAADGGLLIEVSDPGPRGEKADALAGGLREALPEASVSRPVRRAEVRLVGFDESVLPAEIGRALAECGGCPAEEVTLGPIRWGPRRTGSAWARLPLAAAYAAVKEGRVALGWSAARVEALARRPLQCFRCWGFGHMRSGCSGSEDRSGLCFRCGRPGHAARGCAEGASCAVCKEVGRPSDHRMGGLACAAAGSGGAGGVVGRRRSRRRRGRPPNKGSAPAGGSGVGP